MRDAFQSDSFLIATIDSLPTPEQFQQQIESQIWPDVLTFISLALSVGLIGYLLRGLGR